MFSTRTKSLVRIVGQRVEIENIERVLLILSGSRIVHAFWNVIKVMCEYVFRVMFVCVPCVAFMCSVLCVCSV